MKLGDRVEYTAQSLSVASVSRRNHKWSSADREGTIVGFRAGGKLAVKPDGGRPTILLLPSEVRLIHS